MQYYGSETVSKSSNFIFSVNILVIILSREDVAKKQPSCKEAVIQNGGLLGD